MRYISARTGSNVRIIGLSTALANARDLGDWLGIEGEGLFNFRPSVDRCSRVHIKAFRKVLLSTHDDHEQANVRRYSHAQSRQTCARVRIESTSNALDGFGLDCACAADERPDGFVHMSSDEPRYSSE